MGIDAAIEIVDLTRIFGSTTAVDDLSFSVKPGEVFGFIGPNGAGKTTTMRILATLDMPTHGYAWVDGFSVVDDPDRVRRRLGFMPDGFGTYPHVTCEEYLDFFARSYGLKGKQRRESLLRVMEFTQLDRLAQKNIDGLSKGMKQRLCLGRALIHDPGVLILDEPAAGLDPRARIELREMIVQLAKDGKALLISSHILTELAEMCDRVAIIEKGRMLAVGSVEEILQADVNLDENLAGDQDVVAVNGSHRTVTVVVAVLSDLDHAARFLQQQESVGQIVRKGNFLEFQVHSDRHALAELLRCLITEGVQVIEFRTKQKSLEDAFLHVTKGVVQ